MKLSGRSLWDANWTYVEVWHSPSKFTKDDAKSIGFKRFAKDDGAFGENNRKAWLKDLNTKQGGRFYETSAVSTTITQHWDKEVEVPDCLL